MQVAEIYQRFDLFIIRGGSCLTKIHFHKAVTPCGRFQVFTAVLIKFKHSGRDVVRTAVQLARDV
jgi:flagellar motor component MotA